MKIVILPDKFKGSLTASEAAEAIAAGIAPVFPDAELHLFPLADGGEGTLESLTGQEGRYVSVPVHDPLMRPRPARYGVRPEGTAVVEMAAASGLLLLQETERDPGRTTSYGFGELIRHAIGQGAKNVILGIGGSATHDCGTGMLAALGMKFFDRRGKPFLPTGNTLHRIARFNGTELRTLTAGCRFVTACDVTTPLTGPDGAARVYAPQKGAKPDAVEFLERNTIRLAALFRQETGRDPQRIPGGGAAGGTGATLSLFLDSEPTPGARLSIRLSGAEREIAAADLLVTGEGKADRQTLCGKLVGEAARLARSCGLPLVVYCGSLDPEVMEAEWTQAGITRIYPLCTEGISPEEAMQDAAALLRETVARTIPDILRTLSAN